MTTDCVRPPRNRSSRLFFAAVLSVTLVSLTLLSPFASAEVTATGVPTVAVAPQYDTTHVYVPAADFDRFVASLRATPKGTSTVTPTPSKTFSQLVLMPAGTISAFGFQTTIPYPFGAERDGYLVTDMDAGVRAAKASGADLVVAPFPDPIGLDAVIQWPGGVFMQLYWHTSAPNYPALATVPENRVYVSPDAVDRFVHDFLTFSHGSIESDAAAAPGAEIGRPGDTYRRIRIQSPFGKMVVLVTDGHLPYPYGRETTGYEVSDLTATLQKAQSAGVTILVSLVRASGRSSAIVEFPGGYIAELHSSDTH
jgi:hypothetical protein